VTPNNPGGTIFETSEAVLTVAENGVAGSDYRVIPVLDQIHVLNSCDEAMAPLGYVSDGCQPIIVHADGSLVTPSNPALSEEILVIYAFGLGSPVSSVETGHPTPSPVSAPNTAEGLRLRFDFRVNASPSLPSSVPAAKEGLLYSGLVSGFVGLYQINLRLPAVPAGTPSCLGEVESNLTVSVGGASSFDGAPICGQP